VPEVSTGETIVFWVLAPIALGAAIGMVFSRNAVHSALLLVLNFFCLAVFYAMQDAPFLAAVQVIVYTGAIMILFLFVLMLVGVDSSDSLVETLRGQRVIGGVLAFGAASLLVLAIGDAMTDTETVGLEAANAGGNPAAIARLVFGPYVVAFEVTSALLITAALGASVLTQRERTARRRTQKELSRERFSGAHPTPLPGPGVYAHGDSVDRPALLPDGTPLGGSTPTHLEPTPLAGVSRPQALEGEAQR
jgi:NADH-quinone oxidoreductase subunit J